MTGKQLRSCRKTIKIAQAASRILPRTNRQLESASWCGSRNIRIANSYPKTKKQRMSSRKVMLELNRKPSTRKDRIKLLREYHKRSRTKRQLASSKKLGQRFGTKHGMKKARNTWEQVKEIKNGRCEICRKRCRIRKDHCHKTGKGAESFVFTAIFYLVCAMMM